MSSTALRWAAVPTGLLAFVLRLAVTFVMLPYLFGLKIAIGAVIAMWTVGVLVQTNYGGRLVIDGVPVWKTLTPPRRPPGLAAGADGSCMVVVATDAPIDARDLKRLAARAIFALARTGSTYSNGSGDFAIAFSTHPSLRVTSSSGPQPRTVLPTDSVSSLFEAALDATEEAVDNSLLKAVDTTANGETVRALPVDRLKELLTKYGR